MTFFYTTNLLLQIASGFFNLDSAIEREKGVQVIGVHRKLKNFVVTLLVMRMFYRFLGASRTCAFFHDSTAEPRFNTTIK
jgi:hypothetical protein